MITLDTTALLSTTHRLGAQIATHMQSPDENQLWCPGPSLWRLISEHVPGSELSRIHAALGHSLVGMYTEMHAEAEMWHKMWQESRGGNHGSRAATSLPRQQGPSLADPPAVKELLRAEVKMLLQTLRERASRGGSRDGDELLFGYKPETVNYALGHLDNCYSNCAIPGDSDNETRTSSQCSVRSNAEDEIEAVRDKLKVTDIDQVVDRLKSVLMEECEALNTLVKHFKKSIKQKDRTHHESNKSEPTLADLRELRKAIQTELELYPPSFAASPSGSPLRFRLPAGQKANQTLNATSVPRPHPISPLCRPTPRPPVGLSPTKTSACVKPVHSALSFRTHGQDRSTLASNKSSETPVCSSITTSGNITSHFTTDQITVKNLCHLSPQKDSAGLHFRSPTSSASVQIKRNSPVHEAHVSSHRRSHSLSRECVLSTQGGRGSSSVWRSRNSEITPSPISTTGKLKTQSGHVSVSATAQADDDRRKSTSESLRSSAMSETGSPLAKNGDRKSQTDRNQNGHLGKDVTQQQNQSSDCLTDYSSHRPDSSSGQGQAKCSQPASSQLHGQFFTSSKRPLWGTISRPKSIQETKTEPEFINNFYQPVPPARVST